MCETRGGLWERKLLFCVYYSCFSSFSFSLLFFFTYLIPSLFPTHFLTLCNSFLVVSETKDSLFLCMNPSHLYLSNYDKMTWRFYSRMRLFIVRTRQNIITREKGPETTERQYHLDLFYCLSLTREPGKGGRMRRSSYIYSFQQVMAVIP